MLELLCYQKECFKKWGIVRNSMDMVKTGKFIAELRKEQGFTQEQLGEKIGVTNKTVSRWETGTYLPPAEMLLILSGLFGVSINELLCGQRLTEEEYKQAAEENLRQTVQASSFTVRDKIDFYKKKWLKDHRALLIFMGSCLLFLWLAGILTSSVWMTCAAFLLLVIAHVWRNNTMMTYVESNIYG